MNQNQGTFCKKCLKKIIRDKKCKDSAYSIKFTSQKTIGVIIFFITIFYVIFNFFYIVEHCNWKFLELIEYIFSKGIFNILGHLLSISAVFELSYMLFTPGPDEAVEPIILAIASVILIQLSDSQLDSWTQISLIPILVISMGGLFVIRDKYIDIEKDIEDNKCTEDNGPLFWDDEE